MAGTSIAKAYVQIVPSAEGIKGKLTDTLNGEAQIAGKVAGGTLNTTLGKTLTAGVAAGTVISKVTGALYSAAGKTAKAVYEVGKAAVSSYADCEQFVGGVETLFKSSAPIVERYAKNAYKTAGLSANDYMETVTSFSASLLKSLGNDTAKAADKADMAITDMADNANKMGTSMEAIQYAYQGFAKQNYTMLDNLKIGYGGTKSEMERLLKDAEALKAKQGEVAHYSIDSYADIVDAIHVVQTEMGITGTTALESAETISGSMSSAKAAIDNLLVGMVDTDQDIIALGEQTASAVATAFENVAPAIANFMTVGVRAISDAVDPANKVSRAIGEIEEAQERVTSSSNILDLVGRYKSLQEQAERSGVSSGELADIEKELTSVRNQLATATGNAKIAQSESNDELADAVEYEEALAQREKERAQMQLYEDVARGAAAYGEALHELYVTSGELADAEKQYADVTADKTKNAAQEYSKLSSAIDDLSDGFFDGEISAEEMHVKLGEIADSVYSLTGEKVEFKDILAGQDYIDKLSLTFDDLTDRTITTYEELDELRTRQDDLTESTEAYQRKVASLVDNGLLTADEAAGYLGITVDELKDVLDAAAAASDDAAASADGVADAMTEEEAAAQELRKSLADIGTEAYNALSSGEDLRAKYEELTGQLENLDGELDQNTLDMVNTALETLNLAATNQELTNSYPGFVTATQNAGVSLSNLSAWLIDNEITAEEWGSRVSASADGIVNDFAELNTSTGQSVSEMKAALESNIAAYTSWNSNIAKLMSAAVASGDQSKIAFVQSLQDMGIGAADQVAAMAEDIDGTLDEFGPLFADATDQGMLEVKNSIDSGTAPAEAAAKSSMKDIQDAMEKVNFKTTGKEAISDVASGMSSKTSTATNAATNVATSAKSAAGSVNFYSVGYNMDSGMSSGLYGGSSLVSSAARSVAKSAYNAAKAALGIHSPSRLFRDGVGKMITEGISTGMTAPDAIRGLKAASEEVTDSISENFAGDAADVSTQSVLYGAAMRGIVGGELADGIASLEDKLDRLIAVLARMAGVTINVNGTDYQSKMALAEEVMDLIQRDWTRQEAAI